MPPRGHAPSGLRMGWKIAILMAAGSAACSSSAGTTGSSTFPATPWATIASDQQLLHIEIRTTPAQPPTRGLSAVQYVVVDENGAPVDGLAVDVVPWMPVMGHGTAT